jgi:predicted nucleotidyltransferase
MMSSVTLPDDFREFLKCLNAHEVRYLVVGGHAVSFHGYPRFTVDVDVVVMPELENAKALIATLNDFGFGALTLTADDFTRSVTVALGRAPYQVDIMTYIKGVDVEEAWKRRVPGVLDGVDVFFVSKLDLIANKRSVGRPEDLADIERLREIAEDEEEPQG